MEAWLKLPGCVLRVNWSEYRQAGLSLHLGGMSQFIQGQRGSSRSSCSRDATRPSAPPQEQIFYWALGALQLPMKTAGISPALPLWGRGSGWETDNSPHLFLPLFFLFFLGNRHILHWGLHKAKQLQCRMEIQQALPKMCCSLCPACRRGRGGLGHNACASWEAHTDNGLCVKRGTD